MPARGYEFYLGVFAIFEHFPKIFKILQRLPKALTNISYDFPKISEDVRRLSKATEYFRPIFEGVCIRYSRE